jgi:hypothetical protein
MDGDLAYHDARSGAEPPNVSQAIAATLFVVVGVLLGGDGLGSDQTLSCHTIDEGGLQRVCNHRVQAGVLADAEHWEQDVNETILCGQRLGRFSRGGT